MICKGPNCDTEIIWLTHVTSGKRAPIEDEAAEGGNIVVDLDEGIYDVLTGLMLENGRNLGYKLHYNHFARCPDQKRFRKDTP